MPAKSDSESYAELLGPTTALAAALLRLKDEYLNVCADLKHNPYDRPLNLFILSLGRLASSIAKLSTWRAIQASTASDKRSILAGYPRCQPFRSVEPISGDLRADRSGGGYPLPVGRHCVGARVKCLADGFALSHIGPIFPLDRRHRLGYGFPLSAIVIEITVRVPLDMLPAFDQANTVVFLQLI